MQLFVQVEPPVGDEPASCRWRCGNGAGAWLGPVMEGDLQSLLDSLPGPVNSLCLIMPSEQVVLGGVACPAKARRHFGSLAAYEIEDGLVIPVEEVHVAVADSRDAWVPVAYCERQNLAQLLSTIEAHGLEVSCCLPEVLLLPRSSEAWRLHWQDDRLMVHYAQDLGFALEAPLAEWTLRELLQSQGLPKRLDLSGASPACLAALEALLGRLDGALAALPGERKVEAFWDLMKLPSRPSLDLCQGPFARRLPLQRWWRQARGVALLAVAAVLVQVTLSLSTLQLEKARYQHLQQEIARAYRAVIPEGVLVDAEQQLQTQLAPYEGAADQASLSSLLAVVAPRVAAAEQLSIQGITYNAQRRELQLALQAASNGEILSLGEDLAALGLAAQPQQMTRQGSRQQANMIIKGGQP